MDAGATVFILAHLALGEILVVLALVMAISKPVAKHMRGRRSARSVRCNWRRGRGYGAVGKRSVVPWAGSMSAPASPHDCPPVSWSAVIGAGAWRATPHPAAA
jgi:hypothetical protein